MAQAESREFISGVPLFSIFGFKVRLDLSWLLLGLLITWTLAAGVFPHNYPELSTSIYWWMGVAGAIGIFFSIVLHELSHSLVARFYGLPIGGITLFIFGGVAEMTEEPESPGVEFMIAIAGPIASFLLAGLFWLAGNLTTSLGWPQALTGVIGYLAFINLVLGIFNLVPAFPLDGGRILRALLWGWRGNLQTATRIGSEIGAWFGIFLMLIGVLAFVSGSFIGGMWYLLIGAFIRGAAKASYRQLLNRQFLKDKQARDLMDSEPVSVPRDASISQFIEDYVYRHRERMFPVVDDDELVGYVTLDDIKRIDHARWSETSVDEVMKTLSEGDAIPPDRHATDLLRDFARPGQERRLVVDNGRLLGTVSLHGLRNLLSLEQELHEAR